LNLLVRSGRGLWALAILAAAIVPVFLHVATLHRMHWSGSLGAHFWQEAVRPWGARIWALSGVLALAGFASSAAAPGLPDWMHRVRAGALAGGLGVATWLIASLPGLVWLARLGIEGIPFTFAIAALALLAAALIAGVVGAWLEGPAAAAAGAVAGLGTLSLCWTALI